MKRFSVICLQCGLSVDRLIDAETAQTEIHTVTYQQKCKIAPNAADFDCPELERAVERSRRWDQIFRSGYHPTSSDDTIVFPEVLSEAAVKNQKLVAEKAELSARVGAMDIPATPVDLDELRDALSKARALGIRDDDEDEDGAAIKADEDGEGDDEYAGVGLFEE